MHKVWWRLRSQPRAAAKGINNEEKPRGYTRVQNTLYTIEVQLLGTKRRSRHNIAGGHGRRPVRRQSCLRRSALYIFMVFRRTFGCQQVVATPFQRKPEACRRIESTFISTVDDRPRTVESVYLALITRNSRQIWPHLPNPSTNGKKQ